MTKTISIYIFLEDEPSVECITAGNSAEHNATTLKFILESTFTDEFKYYLDFVLPNGKILRTDYLPLDKNDENSVSFDVPASVTKYGTAECCLNAVKIDENGITTEVMKPKNVILYFNTLADADGALLSDYDFSVNTMLENIKNGNVRLQQRCNIFPDYSFRRRAQIISSVAIRRRNARYGILSVGIGIGGEYYSGGAEFGVSDHRDYGF